MFGKSPREVCLEMPCRSFIEFTIERCLSTCTRVEKSKKRELWLWNKYKAGLQKDIGSRSTFGFVEEKLLLFIIAGVAGALVCQQTLVLAIKVLSSRSCYCYSFTGLLVIMIVVWVRSLLERSNGQGVSSIKVINKKRRSGTEGEGGHSSPHSSHTPTPHRCPGEPCTRADMSIVVQATYFWSRGIVFGVQSSKLYLGIGISIIVSVFLLQLSSDLLKPFKADELSSRRNVYISGSNDQCHFRFKENRPYLWNAAEPLKINLLKVEITTNLSVHIEFMLKAEVFNRCSFRHTFQHTIAYYLVQPKYLDTSVRTVRMIFHCRRTSGKLD